MIDSNTEDLHIFLTGVKNKYVHTQYREELTTFHFPIKYLNRYLFFATYL